MPFERSAQKVAAQKMAG